MEKMEIRRAEGLAPEELEAQRVRLLPDRIEMRHRGRRHRGGGSRNRCFIEPWLYPVGHPCWGPEPS
jgi:hypothetical protein